MLWLLALSELQQVKLNLFYSRTEIMTLFGILILNALYYLLNARQSLPYYYDQPDRLSGMGLQGYIMGKNTLKA